MVLFRLLQVLGLGALVGITSCSSDPGSSTSGMLGAGAGNVAIAPVCSSAACCVPVKVDRDRTRAYLVDGVLYFDAFASVEGDAPGGETYWSFDVRLSGDVISDLTCTATHSDDFTQTVSFNACSTAPRQPVACGDRIQLDIRLKSDTYNEAALPLCTGEGLGPSTLVELDIECPTCPSQPTQGMQCAFPRSGSCPAIAYNHWQQREETVGCICGNLFSVNEPRGWSCPVF